MNLTEKVDEAHNWQPFRAAKFGGSYQADGTVVAEFTTLAGLKRCVFEFDQPRGMLHIFSPEQLMPLPPVPTDKI